MCGFPLRPTWAEIDLGAIAHNLRQFKSLLAPGTRLMAIVKADAYGHGAVQVARTAVAAGASFLSVGMFEEAVELRENGLQTPILILGFTPKEYAPYLLQYNITPSVFTPAEARAFSEAAVKAGRVMDVHIKVDTGMTRVGCFPCENAEAFIHFVSTLPCIRIAGLYSHFATADEAETGFAREQLERFLALVRRLEQKGIHIPLKHIANSAGVIQLPESQLDMVRIGIGMYGLYPSPAVRNERLKLRPAMSLKAKIIFVKDVPAGTGISYGRTYVTPKPAKIATLNVGYGDGYSRLLSNKGQVLVHGRRVPIVGRICMDQTMIDVTGVGNVRAGDEAVLFGSQQGSELHVDEVAGWLGTINYEVITSISRRVPRVYLAEGQN